MIDDRQKAYFDYSQGPDRDLVGGVDLKYRKHFWYDMLVEKMQDKIDKIYDHVLSKIPDNKELIEIVKDAKDERRNFLEEIYENFPEVVQLVRFPDDLLGELAEKDAFSKEDWEKISYQNLSLDFIRKYPNKLNWEGIMLLPYNSEEFYYEFKHRTSFDIWKYSDGDWINKFSNEFFGKISDKLTRDFSWNSIYNKRDCDREFIEMYADKLSFVSVFTNELCDSRHHHEYDEEFIIKYWRKARFEYVLWNYIENPEIFKLSNKTMLDLWDQYLDVENYEYPAWSYWYDQEFLAKVKTKMKLELSPEYAYRIHDICTKHKLMVKCAAQCVLDTIAKNDNFPSFESMVNMIEEVDFYHGRAKLNDLMKTIPGIELKSYFNKKIKKSAINDLQSYLTAIDWRKDWRDRDIKEADRKMREYRQQLERESRVYLVPHYNW